LKYQKKNEIQNAIEYCHSNFLEKTEQGDYESILGGKLEFDPRTGGRIGNFSLYDYDAQKKRFVVVGEISGSTYDVNDTVTTQTLRICDSDGPSN